MKPLFPNLSDGQKTKLLFASIGIGLLVFIWLLAQALDRKLDPNYGELVNWGISIVLKSPMPEARVKEPLSGWRLTTKTWFKNTVGNLYLKAGAPKQPVASFVLPDDQRRANLIAHCKQQVKNKDRENVVLSPRHPLSKRVSRLVSPHRTEMGSLQLSVKIYDSPGRNAVSAPDGSIRFDRGILEGLTDDEILVLFGHELGHIVLAHKEEQIVWDANMRLFLFKFSDGTKAKLADPLRNLMSKDDELKADAFSFRWAKYHGYDLTAQRTVLDKLRDVNPSPDHPSMRGRAMLIQGKLYWNNVCRFFSKDTR